MAIKLGANYNAVSGGGSGVTQLVAGTGISLSPSGGTGIVTVTATGGGSGTVTSVSVVTNQGVSGSVATATTTPAITLSLGALTGVTSLNGLVVTANTGAITTGAWAATTIPVNHGGTGATSVTNFGIVYGNGTTAYGSTAAGTTGQFLGANTGSDPTWQTPTASAALTSTYIGYGSTGNTLTGSSSLTYTGYTLNIRDGHNNSFINTGSTTATGNNNLFIGSGSSTAIGLTIGTNNIAIGGNCMGGVLSGTANNGLGIGAMSDITSGNYNVAFGDGTLANVSTGSYNTCLGALSLGTNVSGSNLIAIGSYIDISSNGIINSIGIGSFSTPTVLITASNQFVISPTITQYGWRGVLYNMPVNGGTSGQVLTTDGATPQNLSWSTLSGGVQVAKITITAAEMATGNSVPVQLIATPGSGNLINVISINEVYNFGTLPYTTSGGFTYYTNISGTLFNDANLWSASGNQTNYLSANSNVGVIASPDSPLMFQTLSDDNTGDGTFTLYITYNIITL